MKKLLLVSFSLLLSIFICYGQTVSKLDKDTSKYKNRPFYIINVPSYAPIQTLSEFVLNPNDIDSINVLKTTDHTKLSGEKTNNGVVILKLKKAIKLLNLNQLLTAYHIKESNQNLPVFIDSTLAYEPKGIYADINYIKFVEIATEKETGMKYINICTTLSRIKNKENTIYIRGNAK